MERRIKSVERKKGIQLFLLVIFLFSLFSSKGQGLFTSEDKSYTLSPASASL
jgi:hypothetical protein